MDFKREMEHAAVYGYCAMHLYLDKNGKILENVIVNEEYHRMQNQMKNPDDLTPEEIEAAAKTFEQRGLKGQQLLHDNIKADASVLFARITRIEGSTQECMRLCSIAKTHLELAVMAAVKAISRGDEIMPAA